ncbi:TonB-dependent receptor [bacterium]|nr:TonB-dependent receptor [candidate division CSSED10-310 bacterium]
MRDCRCCGVRLMSWLVLISWGWGAAAAATGAGLPSGEAATNNQLTIVVTATRDAQPVAEAPCAISVLGDRMLRLEKSVRTVPEALKNEPGTMVQKTGHGQGSPYIRGFTGFRSVFMIDGIRLNNSVFRDGPNQYWNTVDPFSLRRIEMVRGPFSMLYGSDAIGGAVNAITRGANDLRAGSTWDRRLYSRYASAERSNITRAETIGKPLDSLVLSCGYTYKVFGDLDGGRKVGRQPKTGYDEGAWDAKAELAIGGGSSLVLAHQQVAVDDAWRTHKTIYGIDWRGLSVGDELRRSLDQDRGLTYVHYHYLASGRFIQEMNAGISHHVQGEDQDRLRTADRRDIQGFDVTTLGAYVSLRSPFSLGSLLYGAEYYHDMVDSYKRTLNPDGSVKSRSIQGPVGDDATYDIAGVYIQGEVKPTSRLSCIVGGRYEYAETAADSVEDPLTGERISVSGDWDAVVGSLRLHLALDESASWNLFAGVSQGFRAPNLSDLTRFDTARTDEIETPSPGVTPEHYVSYEMGIKSGQSSFSAQLAYFYTTIADMIVRTPTGRMIDGDYEVTKKNAGDGYIHGVEFDGRWRVGGGFELFGAASWMDGEVDAYPTSAALLVTEYPDRLMPPTGRLGVRWEPGKVYWLEGSMTVAGRADRLSTRDAEDSSRIPPGGTPGYGVYDFRAGWNCLETLTLSAAVENITDEDYRIHGSGVNEPGRNFVVSADWVF